MRYVYFDPLTGIAIGWIDTERFNFDSLPERDSLLPTNEPFPVDYPGSWIVVDGRLQKRFDGSV